jgi:hypothetical protein
MACEVTLQPLSRFELDAAILFSDILTVPDAMGLGLYFAEGEGPRSSARCARNGRSATSAVPDPNVHLRYVMDAVAEIRRALDNSVPLIGFSGSPWTLACYMVEGGGSRRLPHGQDHALRPARPAAPHPRGHRQAVIDYLNAQIEPGAQAVMIFDSWGGVLSHAAYREFSLAYMQRIVAGLIRAQRRRARAQHRVHQGRRPVAGVDCRHRLRRGRPGLDHGHRRSAPAGRRQGCAAGQFRSDGDVRGGLKREAARARGCGPPSGVNGRPARPRAGAEKGTRLLTYSQKSLGPRSYRKFPGCK